MSILTEKLIDALKACPCCSWERVHSNGPEDGIPDGYVHESVFRCGAAAFLTAEGELQVSHPCPGSLQDELDEIQERIADEIEEGA